ncbi:hypothetical protein BH10PAT2_BH10PAT2_0240 [soil metagenome]
MTEFYDPKTEKATRVKFPHQKGCPSKRKYDQVVIHRDVDIHLFDNRTEVVTNLEESTEVVTMNLYCAGLVQVTRHTLTCKYCKVVREFKK